MNGAVERLVLGTAQWGMPYGIANPGGPPSMAELRSMVDHAASAGVRVLDTARAYGESERRIGDMRLAEAGWRIVTKLSPDVPFAGDVVSATERSVAESLEALRTDRIDTLLLHRAEQKAMHGGQIWQTLQRLKAQGIIGTLGISARTVKEALDALLDDGVAAIQVASSLLDQRLRKAGFFDHPAARGKALFVRSVFLQGVVYMDPATLPVHLQGLSGVLRAISRWERANDVPESASHLLYARSLANAFPVIGAETAGQLRKTVEALTLPPLTGPQLDALCDLVPDLPETILDPALWPAA